MRFAKILSSRVSRKRTTQLHNEERKQKKEDRKKKKAEKKKRKPIKVNVQILMGRAVPISISPDDRIEAVSAKIESREGISPDQQILLFHGLQLDFFDKVDDCHIREGDTLFLTLRNRGG